MAREVHMVDEEVSGMIDDGNGSIMQPPMALNWLNGFRAPTMMEWRMKDGAAAATASESKAKANVGFVDGHEW